VTIKHPSAVKKLMSILPLMKEEPICTTDHLNPEEVVKGSQVLESKLSVKTISELSKQLRGAGRQNDIMDIEEQVSCSIALAVDKQRGIGAGGVEAELMEKRCDALVPSTRRLLKAIE
jgi:hypothetical protein